MIIDKFGIHYSIFLFLFIKKNINSFWEEIWNKLHEMYNMNYYRDTENRDKFFSK